MSSYQPSFFNEADRFEALDRLRDPLLELKRYIDFEQFRPQLANVFAREKRSEAGRKPYDVILMFKILILQRIYNLSDEQVEFQINDRCRFMRFLGLHLGSTVPDFSTVWRFREARLEALGIANYIHDKATRNKPLNTIQLEFNRLKSAVRCRIEHIFGCVENSMGGPELEYIGLARISTGVGLSSLAYNFKRSVQLARLGRFSAAAQGA